MPFIKNTDGDAVVEAVILFPIMIMIFAALVLLAVYLPARAALQRATQHAATVLAVEASDTWLFFNDSEMSYYWETDKSRIPSVYKALFSGVNDVGHRSEGIVIDVESRGISSKAGELSVNGYVTDQLAFKEVVVTASRIFTMPLNLSIIGFPETISITVTSTAFVQNGDEFVRNIDLAVDFAEYVGSKFGITDIGGALDSYWDKAAAVLGW